MRCLFRSLFLAGSCLTGACLAGSCLAGAGLAEPGSDPTSGNEFLSASTWKTIDDHTHQVKAIVAFSEQGGTLSGRVVQLFRQPGEDPNPRCRKCVGQRHEQPVVGMIILWNLHRDGDSWSGGEILDPESGEVYRCILHPIDHGEKLEVRGYIGFSVLGRTQVWERTRP
jgi:uncharacterized protein (DUF2147 family)